MALNPIVYTEKVVRSFLRYQRGGPTFLDSPAAKLRWTPPASWGWMKHNMILVSQEPAGPCSG